RSGEVSGRRHNGAAAPLEMAERLRFDLDSRLVQAVAAMEAKSGPLSREDQRALAASLAQRWLAEIATERAEDGLPPLDPEAQGSLLRNVLDSLFGAAALQPYLDDPTVREVRINGPDTGFIVRIDGTKEPLPRLVRDHAELVYFIQALARYASSGAGGERRFDAAHPVLDM